MIAQDTRRAATRFELFGALEPQPADALLGLIGLYRQDPRPAKIDVGVASHGIYMADSGRINIAGLRSETVAPLAAAIAPYLQRQTEKC